MAEKREAPRPERVPRVGPLDNPPRDEHPSMLVVEEPWREHRLDANESINRGRKLVDEFAEKVAISVSDAGFARMRDHGLGPYPIRTDETTPSAMMRWAKHKFGPNVDQPVTELPDMKTGADGKPLWLLACDLNGEADQLGELLTLCGASIAYTISELDAARFVSFFTPAGVVIRFNNNVDAEFTIADICMRRGIPFVVITQGVARPPSMGLGGVLLHNPRSLEEVLAALESLPAAKTVGLDLAFPRTPAKPEERDQEATDPPGEAT